MKEREYWERGIVYYLQNINKTITVNVNCTDKARGTRTRKKSGLKSRKEMKETRQQKSTKWDDS